MFFNVEIKKTKHKQRTLSKMRVFKKGSTTSKNNYFRTFFLYKNKNTNNKKDKNKNTKEIEIFCK